MMRGPFTLDMLPDAEQRLKEARAQAREVCASGGLRSDDEIRAAFPCEVSGVAESPCLECDPCRNRAAAFARADRQRRAEAGRRVDARVSVATDAVRWRYLRQFMGTQVWPDMHFATLIVQDFMVTGVRNPDATVEEIVHAAMVRHG